MLQPPTSSPQDDLVDSSQKLRAAGRDADAERVIRTGMVRAGASAPLHCELGQALAAQGRHAAAVDSFRVAIRLRPDMATAHGELGQSLRSLGRGAEATGHFDRAAELEPQAGHRRLLSLLHRSTLHDEAGDTNAAFELLVQATEGFPESTDAWAMLGVVQSHLANPVAAEQCLARALQLDPARLDVMERFARSLFEQRKYEDAAIVYERILQRDPKSPLIAGWLLHCKFLMADWLKIDRLQRHVENELAAGQLSAEPFGLQGYCDDPSLLRRAAVAAAARAHPPRPQFLSPAKPGHGSKIRVGYLAGEFREQVTSLLLTEVLERHDRQRFELVAFDTGWDDGSARRQRIAAACEIVPIRGISDFEAARQVRKRGIDVLVNLNGYFGLGRPGVFSMRPAPVQVNYLGFPGTIGAPYIDYIVADATVIPEAARPHYVEQVIYLPHSYQPNDSTRTIATTPLTRSDAGLPERGFVFCCLNNAYKIVPAVFDVWMRLLQRVPDSVLLLYGDKPELQANLSREALQRGVDARRILFAAYLPHDSHLRRLQHCDLFLDTWPYNAHTTGSDALWAGLPVLTCTGRSFPSRVGASLLRAVGLPEMVTHDLPTYEALAMRLASAPGLLEDVRTRLSTLRASAPLFATGRYTKQLEAAYLQMVATARAGRPPAAFTVDERH